MDMAQTIMMALQVWGIIGAVVALVFLTIGMDRIDEDARGAYIFRPLLVPGILMIWPLVLWRWVRIETEAAGWAGRYRPVRGAYGPAVIIMSLGIIVVIIAGFSVRQTWPADVAPLQLSEGAHQ